MDGAVGSTHRKRGRLVVVSGYGYDEVTPRGQRTKRLVEALSNDWDVELVAIEGLRWNASPDGSRSRLAALRAPLVKAASRVLLDRWEPWSVRNLARWRPDADAALLIASPWSPVAYASRRLAEAGVPYVLDAGDPWVLTMAKPLTPMPLGRARRAERFLWEHAAGAVLTTTAQQAPFQKMFPRLPMLVRPNGYKVVDVAPSPARQREPGRLRIAHFGILSVYRIDPVPMILELQRSGPWESIEFCQYGEDFGAGLDRLVSAGVHVEHNATRPWHEVVAHASEFDVALVVSYPLPALLPSKAIEYSALPLPRVGLTNPDPGDALREFARSHAGWLTISNGEADIPRRFEEHLERPWSADELAASPEDAWPTVAARVGDFVSSCLQSGARDGEHPLASTLS